MKIKEGLGIPYMGSKRKLAPKIVQKILKDNPDARFFYDLFGGGGAISFIALQHKQLKKVVYNELNTGIVSLLKDIKENGVTDKYYKWIDRETFKQNKNRDDWYGGLIKAVWSFGNNQRDYLFSKEIEEDKRLLHEIIVNNCNMSLKVFEKKHNKKLKQNNTLYRENIVQKRLRIVSQIKYLAKQRNDLEQLERLQQLQQLQQLQHLEIQNKSYEKVNITTLPEETIIYLDPPYEGTKKYQKDICHNELMRYIKESPYTIYVSSYEFEDLHCVAQYKHRSTLSASANNEVVEKLFCNKPQPKEDIKISTKKQLSLF